MPARRAIEVRLQADGGAPPKWRMSLLEHTFTSFLQSLAGGGGDAAAARAVFAEGSPFSPFLFGRFFDPADAFPLWEFDPDALLPALRRVDWGETDSDYYLRADIPGGRKCEVEVSGAGDDTRVVDISGLWRAPPPAAADGGRDWRAGRWWEHGFVRRVELPGDADWRRVEAACSDDGDGSLEIKVPKVGRIDVAAGVHQTTA